MDNCFELTTFQMCISFLVSRNDPEFALFILELIDLDEKGEEMEISEIEKRIKEIKQDFLKSFQIGVKNLEDKDILYDYMQSFFSLDFEPTSIYGLFQRRLKIAFELKHEFTYKKIMQPKVEDKDDFELQYKKVYQESSPSLHYQSLYKLSKFYTNFNKFQQESIQEFIRISHQMNESVPIDKKLELDEHYFDPNYESLKSLTFQNKRLSYLYKNSLQKSFHYLMDDEYDKALSLVPKDSYFYFNILFEKYFQQLDINNLKLIYYKIKRFQENDLIDFKYHFLLKNYSKALESLKNFIQKDTLDKIIYLYHKVKFLLFLKNPNVIKDIELGKEISKKENSQLFYSRFVLFEIDYYLEYQQQKKDLVEEIEFQIQQNGFKGDIEYLNKLKKSLNKA